MRHFFLIIALALAGCSDVVTTRFVSLDEAQRKHAFERGWLPPILPNSAKNILEENNLDLNTGSGSFQYDLSERMDFTNRLANSGAFSRHEYNADTFVISTNDSRWEIVLRNDVGEANWSSSLLPRGNVSKHTP